MAAALPRSRGVPSVSYQGGGTGADVAQGGGTGADVLITAPECLAERAFSPIALVKTNSTSTITVNHLLIVPSE